MKAMHNVDKSGFHRGEYVGYGCGTVWRITKQPDGHWKALARDKCAPGYIVRSTLGGISESLQAWTEAGKQ